MYLMHPQGSAQSCLSGGFTSAKLLMFLDLWWPVVNMAEWKLGRPTPTSVGRISLVYVQNQLILGIEYC